MTSEARSAAARANGSKSQGPRTEEGKARSADNGLTAGQRFVKRRVTQKFDRAVLAETVREHRHCFGPTDRFERNCVEAMALAEYSLSVLEALKGELLTDSGTLHKLIRSAYGADGYDFLSRWMDREERSLDRAHRRLLRHRASWRKGVVELPDPANDNSPPEPETAEAAAPESDAESADDCSLKNVLGEPMEIRLATCARHLALMLQPGNPERGWSRRQLDLAAAAIQAANGRLRGIDVPCYRGAFDVDEVGLALATVTAKLTREQLESLARLKP